MRTLLIAAAFAAAAGPASAQTPAPPPAAAQVRETAGCAAVFIAMSQMATNPQVVGADPTVAALGAAFARSWGVKGRALYTRAVDQARRDRLPPEGVFEAGVGYLIESYNTAQTTLPKDQATFTTVAARLVERCVNAFPDQPGG
jgi:hypothetical protein